MDQECEKSTVDLQTAKIHIVDADKSTDSFYHFYFLNNDFFDTEMEKKWDQDFWKVQNQTRFHVTEMMILLKASQKKKENKKNLFGTSNAIF